jgi:hypothetical protein
MYIKYGIVLSLSFTAQFYNYQNKFQYSTSNYLISTEKCIDKNKNTMEHNTMSMSELIESNNKQIMNLIYKDLMKE